MLYLFTTAGRLYLAEAAAAHECSTRPRGGRPWVRLLDGSTCSWEYVVHAVAPCPSWPANRWWSIRGLSALAAVNAGGTLAPGGGRRQTRAARGKGGLLIGVAITPIAVLSWWRDPWPRTIPTSRSLQEAALPHATLHTTPYCRTPLVPLLQERAARGASPDKPARLELLQAHKPNSWSLHLSWHAIHLRGSGRNGDAANVAKLVPIGRRSPPCVRPGRMPTVTPPWAALPLFIPAGQRHPPGGPDYAP